jgi:hypothetical protein
MIDPLLVSHIKELLLSAPLDIYSEYEETVSQSSYELVEPRTIEINIDELEEEDYDDIEIYLSRVIGSANLFIAASLVCDEVTHGKTLSDLSEEDLELFQTHWRSLINQLLGERFMRETQEIAHSKIKLVINNRELPNIGVQT